MDNNTRYAWQLIKYYASHFGITCPIHFKTRNLKASYGRCGLQTGRECKADPYPRPYVSMVLSKELINMKHGRAKLHHTIIHELIHGTGNHTHNRNFYNLAKRFNIAKEHTDYKAFAAWHR